MKNLNEMKNLRVYDPGPEKSFTKAKVARLKQERTDLNVSVDSETVATNHMNKFPTADSAFTNDFSLIPRFVPTGILRTAERTLAENQKIPLSNLQVLKVLDCSHLCTTSK